MFLKSFSQLNNTSSDEEVNGFFHSFPYSQYSEDYKNAAVIALTYPLLFKRLCAESGTSGLPWLNKMVEKSLLYRTIHQWIDLFNNDNISEANVLFTTLKKYTNSRSHCCAIAKEDRSLLYLTVAKALIDHPTSKKLCFTLKEKGPHRQWFYELNQETPLHEKIDNQQMLDCLFSRLSLSQTDNEIHISRFLCSWLFNRSTHQNGVYNSSFITTLPLPPKLLLLVSSFHQEKKSNNASNIDEALLKRKDYLRVLSEMFSPLSIKNNFLNLSTTLEREKHFKNVTSEKLISVFVDHIEANDWDLSCFNANSLIFEKERFNVIMKCFDRAAKTQFKASNDSFVTFMLNAEKLSATTDVPVQRRLLCTKELQLCNVFKNLLVSNNTDEIVSYSERRLVLLKKSPSFFLWSKFLDGTSLTALEKEKGQLLLQKENASPNGIMDVLCKKMISKTPFKELENFYDENSCFKPLVCDAKNNDLFQLLFFRGLVQYSSVRELLQNLSRFCKKNMYFIKDHDIRYAVLNATAFEEGVSMDELIDNPEFEPLVNEIVLNTTQECFNTGRFCNELQSYQPRFEQIVLSNALFEIEKEKNQTGPKKRKI